MPIFSHLQSQKVVFTGSDSVASLLLLRFPIKKSSLQDGTVLPVYGAFPPPPPPPSGRHQPHGHIIDRPPAAQSAPPREWPTAGGAQLRRGRAAPPGTVRLSGLGPTDLFLRLLHRGIVRAQQSWARGDNSAATQRGPVFRTQICRLLYNYVYIRLIHLRRHRGSLKFYYVIALSRRQKIVACPTLQQILCM